MYDKKEVNEAIIAGERALSSLYLAKDKLKSARGWGIFDLLGGGFFTDMIKHSKMKEASRYMQDAQYQLKLFQKELKDVNLPTHLHIEVGGFLSFADFFFDGFIADYLVQSKISEARTQVEDAINRVEKILHTLRNCI